MQSEPHSIMAVSDISGQQRYIDKTQRHTDPCNPHYFINGMEYRDDKHSKPTVAKKQIADNLLLQTKDIAGATAGVAMTAFERKEFRNTNFIGDIAGSQADSTKHSIVTNRKTNPLTPVYQSLDGGSYLQPLIPPLLPPEVVKLPTIPHKLKVTSAPVPSGRDQKSQPASHSVRLNVMQCAFYTLSLMLRILCQFQLDLGRSDAAKENPEFSFYATGTDFAGVTRNSDTASLPGSSLHASGRLPSERRAVDASKATTGFSPFVSPTTSARGVAQSRKASQDRQEEINLVRQLQNWRKVFVVPTGSFGASAFFLSGSSDGIVQIYVQALFFAMNCVVFFCGGAAAVKYLRDSGAGIVDVN